MRLLVFLLLSTLSVSAQIDPQKVTIARDGYAINDFTIEFREPQL